MPMFLTNLRGFNEEGFDAVTIDLDGDKAPDLSDVEDNILTSHDAEVDDATCGLIGDPVDESYNLLAESEYNWNQIMQAVGLHELNEMARGREILYEAVDIKGFLTKAKEFFKKILTKVANIVKRYASNGVSFLTADKRLLEKYGTHITTGQAKYDDKFKGYEFTNMKCPEFDAMAKPITSTDLTKERLNAMDTSNLGEESQKDLGVFRALMCDSRGEVNASDYQQELFKHFRNKQSEPIDLGKPSADIVKKVLGENKLIKDAKDAYRKYEKGVNEVLKGLHKLESSVRNDFKDDDENRKARQHGLSMLSSAITTTEGMAGIAHTALTAYLSAMRKRHSQYRHIANTYIRAANKSKYPVKESATSFFDSLNLL